MLRRPTETVEASDAADNGNRISLLQRALIDRGLDACVIGPFDNLRYLLSFEALALERLTALIVTPKAAVMVLPDFDAAEFSSGPGRPPTVPWSDRAGPGPALELAFASVGPLPRDGRVLIDDELPFAFLSQLGDHLPATLEPAGPVLSELRLVKRQAELESIAAASDLVSRGIEYVFEHAQAGMTEGELKARVQALMREAGSELADYVLVQAGPSSAHPHHVADCTPLKLGEPVLVDIAVRLNGYFADITQQVFIGPAPDDYRERYEVVRAAQAAGVAAATVGATAHDVAVAASVVIIDAGLGEWNGPRTGHGLGLGLHESPSIVEGNTQALPAGAVITVEPGIYIPDRYGIRIEDTIAVLDDGPRRLTRAARALVEVGR